MTFKIKYFVIDGKLHGHVTELNVTLTGHSYEEIQRRAIEIYKSQLRGESSKYSDPSILSRKKAKLGR